MHDTSKDARLPMAAADTQSLVILPLRFGDRRDRHPELEHHKRHMYRGRDLAAMATLATQVATAIHIAELRRPLVTTVDSIGAQVGALARATESLHASADALTAASQSLRTGLGEQDAFVTAGLKATKALAQRHPRDMAVQGKRAAEASARAAETAAANRETIRDAIRRLVDLKHFVAESSRQVGELGHVTKRITGFIGSIREIADLTNLISLNAAIEAARAGQEGKGFAVVADEVRDLADQSAVAAREAGGLLAAIAEQVTEITAQMSHGERAVEGVEQLGEAAVEALEGIVNATREAGASRAADRRDGAASRRARSTKLQEQIGHLAAGLGPDPRGDQRAGEPGRTRPRDARRNSTAPSGSWSRSRRTCSRSRDTLPSASKRAVPERGGGGARQQPGRPGGPPRRGARRAGRAPRHPLVARLHGGGNGAARRARPAALPQPGGAARDGAGPARAARGLPGDRARAKGGRGASAGPRAPSTSTSFSSATPTVDGTRTHDPASGAPQPRLLAARPGGSADPMTRPAPDP